MLRLCAGTWRSASPGLARREPCWRPDVVSPKCEIILDMFLRNLLSQVRTESTFTTTRRALRTASRESSGLPNVDSVFFTNPSLMSAIDSVDRRPAQCVHMELKRWSSSCRDLWAASR